jgi:hypothetical protein
LAQLSGTLAGKVMRSPSNLASKLQVSPLRPLNSIASVEPERAAVPRPVQLSLSP